METTLNEHSPPETVVVAWLFLEENFLLRDLPAFSFAFKRDKLACVCDLKMITQCVATLSLFCVVFFSFP